jgi:AraC-like DNA-binding protein
MHRTLLAVGPWRECGRIVVSAVANRWSVLYTLLFEDIPVALRRTHVDLILLAGCSSRPGWEGVAHGAWEICGDAPVLALGAGPGQDALVSALVGGSLPDGDEARPTEEACETFRCSEVSPTLKLYEPKSAGAGPGIGRALELIEERYAEPITLDDAARAARYSRCHFSKIFRERLGVCFISYLVRVRVRRAAELLARTEMPVTLVALEVGFNDLSHFERVFRSAYKRSPSKYRAESKEIPHMKKYPPSLPSPVVTS